MQASRINKITLIGGGVGGARMARGFCGAFPSADVTVIVNVGDDDWFHGLYVCPDFDTILYTLAGVVDEQQGWGVKEDTTRALEVLHSLSSPDSWMKLGDSDIGLHIFRTDSLAKGRRLTEVSIALAATFRVNAVLLPVTDLKSPTMIETDSGVHRFQEWFVRDRGTPVVRKVHFREAAMCAVTAEVRAAIEQAELIVFAPSNPYLSVQPILAVGAMRQLLAASRAPKIGVSPLIGGHAIKGPLAKLMLDFGASVDNATIAREYEGEIDLLVIDQTDATDVAGLQRAVAMDVLPLPTLIKERGPAMELALAIVEWAQGWR